MTQDRCDILVAGAGILGAASAYHLKRAMPERDILLIDRAGVAQGNTGRSVAMVRDAFTSGPRIRWNCPAARQSTPMP